MRLLFLGIFCLIAANFVSAQNPQKSFMQQESEYYNSLGISGDEYEHINKPAQVANHRNTKTCTLDKMVYGWHPYWCNGLEANYDWNLISRLSYFSYDVDPATGNATSTHSWSTANVVTEALNNGVKVDLCVTLFSSHATFFGSSTSQQTLITNLINLVQARGANGVNIDFEGVPSTQKTNLTNFLISLCNQMHAAIPDSKVSIALYAIDWSSVFDMATLNNYLDYFIIMGYDYWYGSSTTAGPTDPLYPFGSTANYTLSYSVNYYLNQGASLSKLILGLPYYGFEYTTTSGTMGASVSNPPNSATKLFKTVKANTSGYYSTSNNVFDANSYSNGWIYQTGGEWKQCFVNSKYTLEKRMDLVNYRGIGGIGIWALSYDDGYSDYWDAISEKLTDCHAMACTDTIFDMGGPNKNYYNSENYTYTIQPAGATGLSLNFTSFSLEANYDYLYIYDGVGTTNLIGQYTGTTSPGTINASGNALTLKFTSDGATVAAGFTAIWNCSADNIAPTTSIAANNWETANFTSNFTDNDNVGIDNKFYQVLDYNGTEWRANANYGFFNDNFETAIHPEWTALTGTWTINSAHLEQTQQVNSNTNIYTSVAQDASHEYLYQMQMKIDGTGTNRRAGFYIMCSDPTLDQRGEGYMIYYRVDNSKVQLYRVSGNVITIVTDDVCTVTAGTWYDIKVTYNPATGSLKTYQNNILVSQWTDPSPVQTGNAISLRTGDCDVMYDDIKVYKSRTANATVSIGNTSSEVRYQNPNPSTPSCRIKSIVIDSNENWSDIAGKDVNIDWTAPALVSVNDGLSSDIDTVYNNSSLSASWNASSDSHSGISEYWYAIGTSPGATNVTNWTNNGTSMTATVNGLSLFNGYTYYFSVKTKNGAGLFSGISSSDGVVLAQTLNANFILVNSNFCVNDNILFENNSTGATSYLWTFEGGTPATSTLENPSVQFSGSGNHIVQLIANNGAISDTAEAQISTHDMPVAGFTTNTTSGNIPLTVLFTNNSSNANYYFWNFGNGLTSNGTNPYTTYNDTGYYDLQLIACNNYCPCDTITLENNIHAYGTYLQANFIVGASQYCMNDIVTFVNNSIGATSYLWTFEGGTPATSTATNPTIQYAVAGDYEITLIAYNSTQSDTIHSVISIWDLPVAGFTTNITTGEIPLDVSFTNSSTNTISYSWDFGNGLYSTETNPTVQYTDTGYFNISLIACSYGCGCDTAFYENYIYAYFIDTISAAAFSTDNNHCNNETIHFFNNSTGATSYIWTFEGGYPASSTLVNPDVVYSLAGTYNIQLIAYNSQNSDTINSTITIYNAPVANFTSNITQGSIPLAVLFMNTSANSTQYTWNFGNGNISTDSNPYTFYNDSGYYNVSLIACNQYCPCDTLEIQNYIHAIDTSVFSELITNTENFVSIYPQPFTKYLYIEFYSDKINENKFEIFDSKGILVEKFSFQTTKTGFQKFHYALKAKYSNGIYFIKMTGFDEKTQMQKIVYLSE